MRVTDKEAILKQFETLEAQKEQTLKASHRELTSTTYTTMALACIIRVSGTSSVYAQEAQAMLDRYTEPTNRAYYMRGIIDAFKKDIESGYLSTLRELIHADVFDDLLENAEYFLSEGHKDPAAVIIGGVLESHLRKLCEKNGIPLEFENVRGEMKPKTGDTLNNDLARTEVYNKLEQKQITAWLDLRNKAAHGQYDQYSKEHVDSFLRGLRDFIIRFPA